MPLHPQHNEREERYCETCHGYRMHEWVKNFYTYYWRCEACVNLALSSGEPFVPSYQYKSYHRYKNNNIVK